MNRVSLDGGSIYIRRAYALFWLASVQWQTALKNGSESENTNQAAYYDARWHLVEAIHSELSTQLSPIPLDIYTEMLRRAEMEHLQHDEVRFYLEPVEGNMYGQMRVHLFYGGEDRWDKQSRKMCPNPIGKGHGHKIVIINADGFVVAINEGRKPATELEPEFAQ